jgi:hypothetical protein
MASDVECFCHDIKRTALKTIMSDRSGVGLTALGVFGVFLVQALGSWLEKEQEGG